MLTATRRALARTVPSSAQADVAACVVESATLHGTLPAPLSHIQVRARSSATRRRVPRSRSNASRPPRRVHHDTRPPPPRRDPDPHDPDLPSSAAAEISVWSRPLSPPPSPGRGDYPLALSPRDGVAKSRPRKKTASRMRESRAFRASGAADVVMSALDADDFPIDAERSEILSDSGRSEGGGGDVDFQGGHTRPGSATTGFCSSARRPDAR